MIRYSRKTISPDHIESRKLSIVGQSLDGRPKPSYHELLHASEGTLSRWSRLHMQSLAPTNLHWASVLVYSPFSLCVIHGPTSPHWARVVGYGPFSLCVIHKEGLCPSSGDINRLRIMMMMTSNINFIFFAGCRISYMGLVCNLCG
jgi:hypothetical protein